MPLYQFEHLFPDSRGTVKSGSTIIQATYEQTHSKIRDASISLWVYIIQQCPTHIFMIPRPCVLRMAKVMFFYIVCPCICSRGRGGVFRKSLRWNILDGMPTVRSLPAPSECSTGKYYPSISRDTPHNVYQ